MCSWTFLKVHESMNFVHNIAVVSLLHFLMESRLVSVMISRDQVIVGTAHFSTMTSLIRTQFSITVYFVYHTFCRDADVSHHHQEMHFIVCCVFICTCVHLGERMWNYSIVKIIVSTWLLLSTASVKCLKNTDWNVF